MRRNLRHICLSCVAVLTFAAIQHGSAFSQNKIPSSAADAGATPVAAPAGAPNIIAPATAVVDGFRSAKFGMTDVEVEAAIEKDFKIKPADVQEQPNPAERTTVLAVKVPDLLPGGGTAEVAYVLGYGSKKLIQISVSWSKATDDKMTPEQLFSDSSVLRTHFLTEGFKPDTVASNMPINSGILIFRGSDANGHAVIQLLQGTMSEGANNQKVLTPASLLLFYIEDAKAPDVYRLPPGSF
jgi:hypothetical protein